MDPSEYQVETLVEVLIQERWRWGGGGSARISLTGRWLTTNEADAWRMKMMRDVQTVINKKLFSQKRHKVRKRSSKTLGKTLVPKTGPGLLCPVSFSHISSYLSLTLKETFFNLKNVFICRIGSRNIQMCSSLTSAKVSEMFPHSDFYGQKLRAFCQINNKSTQENFLLMVLF